jgi:ATP-dependent protease ClpP protease subunit
MDNRKPPEINSEQHTLFIKNVSESSELVDREKGLYKLSPKHKIYTVYIEGFREFKRGLHKVLHELRNASKNDILEFRINSGGGLVNEGQQFYNLIEEKFHNRSVAFLDNHGYSMGALLFCMADRRVIYPYSDLMFHNYSGGAGGKGGEMKSRIKHKDKVLTDFFKKIVQDKGFLTKDEFNKMLIGQDYWMDAKEMCKRKIATHVIYQGEMISAKEYLKMLKKQGG